MTRRLSRIILAPWVPGSFVRLCAVGFIAFVSYDIARHPIVPLFAQSLGAGSEGIGLIVAMSTITGIIVKWPAGVLSDRIGRPQVLMIALIVVACLPFLYGWVTEVWHLMVIRLVHGLFTALFAPTAMATVAELAPEHLGQSLGWYSAVTQSGRLTGRVVGGYSVQFAGFGQTYILAGLIGLAGWLLFLVVFPQLAGRTHATAGQQSGRPAGATADHESRQSRRPGSSAASPWRDTRLRLTSMMQAAQMLATGALEAFLPIHALGLGLQPGQVGLLFGLHAGASLIMKPTVGRLSDRLGRRRLIVSGVLLTAATFSFLPFLTAFLSLAGLMLVLGTSEAMTSTASSALAADLAGGERLGSVMGGYGAIMDIGHAGGPILTGLLISLVGMKSAFLFVSAGLVGVAVTFYRLMVA